MMRRSLFLPVCLIGLATAVGGFSQHPSPAQNIAELQARFDRELNSVRKTKLLARLGNAQFLESRRAGKARDYVTAGLVLEKYRDNVREAIADVIRQHPNAEKESNGYRIIEVHVRLGLREVEEAILMVPPEYRPPLQLVRDDLAGFQDKLLRLLFPRRPGEKRAPGEPPQGGY